jgi:hypothetical protein
LPVSFCLGRVMALCVVLKAGRKLLLRLLGRDLI